MSVGKIIETTSTTFIDVTELNMTDPNTLTGEYIEPLLKWFREAEALTARRVADPYLPTGQPLLEAFWRTLLVGRVDTPTHPIEEFGEFYKATKTFLEIWTVMLNMSDEEQSKIDAGVMAKLGEIIPLNARFMREMGHCGGPRHFAVTDNGYVALVPPMTAVGDEVVLIGGAKTPFLVRRKEGGKDRFQLVGELYVHGIMNGEAVKADGFGPLVLV